MPLFNEFVPRSPVIELPAKSPFANKKEVRVFSSKKDEIDFDKYLLKFRTFLISDKSLSEIKKRANFFV